MKQYFIYLLIILLAFLSIMALNPNSLNNPRAPVNPKNSATPKTPHNPVSIGSSDILFYLSGAVNDGQPAGFYTGEMVFSRASQALEGTMNINGVGDSFTLANNNVLRQLIVDNKKYILIEGQRTNYVKNNYVANDTSGWSQYGGTPTITRQTGVSNAPYNGTALRVAGDGAAHNEITLITTYLGLYTFSRYVTVNAGTTNHKAYILGSTTYSAEHEYIPVGYSQKTIDNQDDGNDSIRTRMRGDSSTYNEYTLIQMEYGEFGSSPIPNTTLSAVTRAADSLSFQTAGNISADEGVIEMCFAPLWGYNDISSQTGDPILMFADNDFKLIYDESVNSISFVAGGTSVLLSADFSRLQERCIYARWKDGEKLQLRYTDDTSWQESASNYSTVTLDDYMFIGSDNTPDEHFYGGIRNVKIYPHKNSIN